MDKVLVIEDDVMIGDMLLMYLSEEGYEVKRAAAAREGLKLAESFEPDIVLLDLVLPDGNGIEVCRELRSRSPVPIMVVSMKTDVFERVQALKAGADDFMCKPFSMHELTARIEAIIRRSRCPAVRAETAASSEGGQVLLDEERRLLFVDGRPVETTFSEFEIMKQFITHPGKAFSREELINAVRGFDSFVTERAVDVHIVNLRRKIEPNPKEPRRIRTVRGVGYKYTEDGPAAES